jgi:subtilase family serine protease
MLLYDASIDGPMAPRSTMVQMVAVMAVLGFLSVVPGGGVVQAATAGNSVVHFDLEMHYVGTSLTPGLRPGECAAFGDWPNLHCYTPQEIQSAYNFAPAYKDVGGIAHAGAGQTIVIFDPFGDPTVRKDLAKFDAIFGLPHARLNIICPMGCPKLDMKGDTPLSLDEVGWTLEIALDTQASHALAPAATIDLVVAWNDSNMNMAIAEEYALEHHLGNIWSQSFGTPECAFTPGPANPWFALNNKVYSEAAKQGVTIYAATSDGWSQGVGEVNANPEVGCASPAAQYPSDNPNNIGVQGTHLSLRFGPNAPEGKYRSETTWNSCEDPTLIAFEGGVDQCGEGGTGGGPSHYFSQPWWQSGLTVKPYNCLGATPASCTTKAPHAFVGKSDADVAFDGDPDGGVFSYWSSAPQVYQVGLSFVGGTSVGSPCWAAISAILDQLNGGPLGNIAPELYFLGGTGAFHDITVGSSTFYPNVNYPAYDPGRGYLATPGWNGATGMGTPNVGVLVDWV